MTHARRVRQFEQVRDRYGRFLESVLWKLTGERDLFAEALQNALLAMWQHLDKLDGPGPGGYIYRIALSVARKAWRNRAGATAELSDNLTAADPGPDEQAGDRELLALVRRTITDLPDRQGKAIVMRYLQNQDYQTLATEMACTPAAARSHVSKALAALKDKLKHVADMEVCNEPKKD